MIKVGLKPQINLIGEFLDEDGNEKEKYHIKLGWQVSPNDMLNSSLMPGGEGFQKGKNLSKQSKNKSAMHRRRFTNEELEKIAIRINNGEFMKDIAKEYDVHKVTLSRNLNGYVINTNNIKYKKNRHTGPRKFLSEIEKEDKKQKSKLYYAKWYQEHREEVKQKVDIEVRKRRDKERYYKNKEEILKKKID